MSKNFKIKGMNNLNKAIKQQIHKVEENTKSQQVSMSELFDNGFMSDHSKGKFSTFSEFVTAKFNDIPFADIPELEFDEWVNTQTDFTTWKDFQIAASNKILSDRLGF